MVSIHALSMNLQVGDFTFSALFHSYSNPTEMCGECGPDGETVTCQMANMDDRTTCRFRFIYCLQPHGSPASESDVPFELSQSGLDLSGEDNSYTFQEGFLVQNGTTVPNFWNRSNPFTREFQTWPVRILAGYF